MNLKKEWKYWKLKSNKSNLLLYFSHHKFYYLIFCSFALNSKIIQNIEYVLIIEDSVLLVIIINIFRSYYTPSPKRLKQQTTAIEKPDLRKRYNITEPTVVLKKIVIKHSTPQKRYLPFIVPYFTKIMLYRASPSKRNFEDESLGEPPSKIRKPEK